MKNEQLLYVSSKEYQRGYMTTINNIIPEGARYILYQFAKLGYKAYLVGGCVRDIIMKRKPHDWDICTNATPTDMMNIAKYLNEKNKETIKVIPTGLQHGTLTLMINGEGFEVTTFRCDGTYSDNRRPDDVTFTDNLTEDLKRRDFTINAIAYSIFTGFIDPYNGIQDIKDGKITCVGSAKERFNEDALRILRAIRFSSQLDFVTTPDTDWEIHRQYKNLSNISIERINSEFCKIAASNSFCIPMVIYKDVIALFIPEIKDMFNFPQNNPYHNYDVYDHTIHAIEACDVAEVDDLIVKLAVFFHDIGKPHCYQDDENGIRHFKGHGRVSAEITNIIMRRMKFDNETREKVIELVYYHDATFEMTKKHIKRWLNKIGEEQFRRLLLVRKADIQAQNPDYKEERLLKIENISSLLDETLNEKECFSLKDLKINGSDLISLGYKEGKTIGFILNHILQKVMDNDLKNEKSELVEYVKNNKIEVGK